MWYTVEKPLVGVSKKFDGDKMLQYIDQTVLLIWQAFDSVSYSRRMNLLTGVETEKVTTKNTLKNQASPQWQRKSLRKYIGRAVEITITKRHF